MEPSPLPQSSVAPAPLLGAGLATILASPDSLLPLPCPPGRTGDAPGLLTEPATIRLTFPAKPVPVAVGPILAAALDSRWQSYRKQLRQCQEKFSEEAVHELRVATRRLLAQLTLLGCVTPSATLEKARRILKSRLAALGDLRDTQVQRLFIEQKVPSFPELVLLRGWFQRRERRLAKSAVNTVNRFKTRKLERWISTLMRGLTANARRSRVQDHRSAE